MAAALHVQFREKPWDLIVCAGYTAVAAGVLLITGTGTPLAALLVVFAPGYALLAALFPGKAGLSWIERITFSFALSIGTVAVVGLGLDYTSFGIRFSSVIISLSILALSVSAFAYWRRIRLPSNDRLALDFEVRRPVWKEYQPTEKKIVVGLVAAIIITGAALAIIVVSRSPGSRFSEFYLLGPNGRETGYPTNLRISQAGSLILGIANHEGSTIRYLLQIDLVGVEFNYNTSMGHNETVEVNRTAMSAFNLSLSDGEVWNHLYTFSINYSGLWKVQFRLFQGGDLTVAYRQLHIYVTVS